VLDTARKQQVATRSSTRNRAPALRPLEHDRGLPASGTITIDSAGTISGNETSFALSNYHHQH